jgi:hypothetical protein
MTLKLCTLVHYHAPTCTQEEVTVSSNVISNYYQALRIVEHGVLLTALVKSKIDDT